MGSIVVSVLVDFVGGIGVSVGGIGVFVGGAGVRDGVITAAGGSVGAGVFITMFLSKFGLISGTIANAGDQYETKNIQVKKRIVFLYIYDHFNTIQALVNMEEYI